MTLSGLIRRWRRAGLRRLDAIRAWVMTRLGWAGGKEQGVAATDGMSWLASPAPRRRLRWALSPRQNLVVGGVLVITALLIAPMIWPHLPAWGPVWLIYALHDTVILPLKGRFLDRYDPMPQIILAVLVGLALLAVFSRHWARGMYSRACYLALRWPWSAGKLLGWAQARGRDLVLLAEVERALRDAQARWFLHRRAVDADQVARFGRFLIDAVRVCPDEGRSDHMRLGAAQAVLRLEIHALWTRQPGLAPGRVQMLAVLGRNHALAPVLLPLTSPFEADLQGDGSAEALVAQWDRLDRARAGGLGEAPCETLLWGAALWACRSGDPWALRQMLERNARAGFDAAAQGAARRKAQARAMIQIDPVLWYFEAPEGRRLDGGAGLAPDHGALSDLHALAELGQKAAQNVADGGRPHG